MLRHKITLLKEMKKQGEITAGRIFGISNANQYLVELFYAGIITFRWITEGGRRFKLWRIVDNEKAERILRGGAYVRRSADSRRNRNP